MSDRTSKLPVGCPPTPPRIDKTGLLGTLWLCCRFTPLRTQPSIIAALPAGVHFDRPPAPADLAETCFLQAGLLI